MIRSAKPAPKARYRLLAGASAVALLTAGAPVLAAPGGSNPFARVVDPAAAVAQAAASQASQAAAVGALSAQAQASFAQAAALRSQMDSVQAAQRAAVAAAQSSVPNGLTIGGLQPVSGAVPGSTLWQGANAPVQSNESNGRTAISIQQTAPQAILNWQTFNVGQQTDLTFQQGATTWAVLNRITDPTLNPTKILGTINAPGTVLIMNPNGIIFGGASQVNVGAIVAGAANISDSQFLNNGIYSAQSNSAYVPSFTGAGGAVLVQQGAQITTAAPSSVDAGGGYVMLLGTSVENDGVITTPMGQTLMAAGDNFLVRSGYSTASNQNSTTNGSEVAVQLNTNSASGSVTNAGEVISDQGDITLVGHTLLQNGILLSTTDVTQRGTIHLLNSVRDATGSITLAPNSVTQILPDLASGATAVEAQRAGLIGQGGFNALATGQFDDLSTVVDQPVNSRVEIVTGGNVEFQGASLVQATGGQISASAVGRVQVDTGAVLDVSGSNTSAAVSSNFISVDIQGEEESDNPLNRDAKALFNDDVWVDTRDLIPVAANVGGYPTARYYTPGGVLNVTGEYANLGSTIGQWTAAGGTITLATGASGSVVAQTGSVFNIAGGSISYTGGVTPQSYVIASNGGVYNINFAPSNLTYTGFYTGFVENHPHWGVSETYGSALLNPAQVYQAGYVVGRDAGSLNISAPTAVFEGQVNAGVVDGANQTTARDTSITDASLQKQTAVPLAGSLSIDSVAVEVTPDQLFGIDYTPAVVIGQAQPLADQLTVSMAIPTSRTATIDLDASQLSSFALGGLSINAGQPNNGVVGSITLNAPLGLADGGSLSFTAPTIALNANLTAHGGAVSVNANGGLGAVAGPTTVVGNLTVGQNVTIDTTGIWTNAELNPGNLAGLAFLNGGDVSLISTGNLILGAGSLIDASSGGAILLSGKTSGGAGGAIALEANYRSPTALGLNTNLFGAQGLVLGGTLRSEGVTGGGALTLSTSGLIAIGNQAVLPGGLLAAGTPAPTALTLATDLVLSAGATMPVTYAFKSTVVGAGQAFSVAAQPNLSMTNTVTTAAAWTVPAGWGTVATTNNGNFPTGATVPAGSIVWLITGSLPVGTIVPANVFPNGLPVPSYTAILPKGGVLSSSLTLPAGTLIPLGTVFDQSVTTQELDLAPSFFAQGFSAYNITGQNVQVAPNTAINVVMPVLQFTKASIAAATGSSPETALTLWTPPLYMPNPATGVLTQRAGASLTLNAQLGLEDAIVALANGVPGAQVAPLTIGQGAAITVDPSQSVSLNAWGELDVEGAIHAPGGTISLLNTREFELENTGVGGATDPALSIWVGGNAVLDAAGRSATALDLYGRSYGLVQNGGSIALGGPAGSAGGGIQTSTEAFVVIRPGAVLNASGASATLDFGAGQARGLGGAVAQDRQLVAGNGGSISLSSDTGLFIEGNLLAAAGGPGAAGGTLSLTLESPIYTTNGAHAGFVADNSVRALRVLTVDQTAQPSALSATLAPAQVDPALLVGSGQIGVDQINAGGFGNLSLYAGDAIAFNGNVNLSLSQSLSLNQGAVSLSASTPNAQVILSAPYVLLNGNVGHLPQTSSGDIQYIAHAQPMMAGTGTLTIAADQIDVENPVGFGGNWTLTEKGGSSPGTLAQNLPGFAVVSLVSQGDITFQAGAAALNPTSLISTGNIDLTAARIYPATGVTALVLAGAPTANGDPLSPTGVLTIANVGNAPDSTPANAVFGTLLLDAATINQGGVVEAPLGALVFGLDDSNITSSSSGALPSYAGTVIVNFLPGSITSVSANGLTMPYGGTSDGLNYLYNGAAVTYVDPFNETGRPSASGTQYSPGVVTQGLQISSASVNVQSGALLDLSGGGNLTGAGFVTGEGGSVDVLHTPLVNANPTNLGSASDKVYAIIPGVQSGYAPATPDAGTTGAGSPGVGQQVTIGAGVPGLLAGTYTLLPSTYALLPGAFRVEIAGQTTTLRGVGAVPNGSYETGGNLGIANTGIKNAIANELILTPASTVMTYSQYNQTSYAQFAEQQAALFGAALPSLPIDAKLLMLDYAALPTGAMPALTMNGTLNQAPGQADGLTGAGGALIVTTSTMLGGGGASIDILGPGQAPLSGALSLNATDLDAFHAGSLVIGGVYWEDLSPGQAIAVNSTTPTNVAVYQGTTGSVTVEPGAVLTAPQIFLLSNSTVTISNGATVSTIGQGAAAWDSTTNGVVAEIEGIALSNGAIALQPYTANNNGWLSHVAPTNGINIQSGATLLAGGTLGFEATNGLTLGSQVTLGAKDLVITVPSVNIGSATSLAAAQTAGVLPAGWSLDQSTLNNLMAGDAAAGVPALQSLVLTANNSVNFFGTVDLSTVDPTSGKSDLTLVLSTPAIYGVGSASDVATLTTGTLIWNGIATGSSALANYAAVVPPAAITNGPGTGSGTLDLAAQQIVFGYGPNTTPQDQVALPRQTLGFATVNLEASQSITANNSGTLAVYQSKPTGSPGAGGTLNLVTPLLTGQSGSVMGYTAGGAINISAPAGAAPAATSNVATLGAEVDLNAASVTIDSSVALPTGKLVVNATNNIQLGSSAAIDLSGRATPLFDQTEYSWGGDVLLSSAQGNIVQAQGSVIDVSAVNNSAGSITAQAVGSAAGQVAFNGKLLGAPSLTQGAAGIYSGGSITVDAQSLASGNIANLTADFAALNTALDAGGFFAARSFDLKQGGLVIAQGQTVKAHTVSISVDGGDLMVNGTIDASGAVPGNITLSASNNLTLAGSGLLDAHGTVLQADSYGSPIDAENRAAVSLTTKTGALTLAPGATINVTSLDPNPQGDVELNVPRIGGEIGGNANIVASGPVNITGAGTIALNAFWTYAPTDANGTIVQDNTATGVPAGAVGLKQIDAASQSFMTAADTNATLQGNLAGLVSYGSTFHLRPGVEIDSSTQSGGNLTTSGDIDLSGYRYSDPLGYGKQVTGVYGSGEPTDLVIRAARNLNVNGGIADGFAGTPGMAGVYSGIITDYSTAAHFRSANVAADGGLIYVGSASTFYMAQAWTVPNLLLYQKIPQKDVNGVTYGVGATIPFGTVFTTFDVAGVLNGTPGAPSIATVQVSPAIPGTSAASATASLLAPGSLSASIRLVSGADILAADTRAVLPQSSLGSGGNLILNNATFNANAPVPSEIRTGTGNLELYAGNNFSEGTLYGIYTAGTQSGDVTSPYETPSAYDTSSYQAYYPTNGGDLTLLAQGNVSGYSTGTSNDIGSWLWEQGGAGLGQPGAWWINFGASVPGHGTGGQATNANPVFTGFSGIGTLGGGNLTLIAGGNAGVLNQASISPQSTSTALNLAVASTGRVLPNGTLEETGGGALTIQVGGALNPAYRSGTFNQQWGVITDLRGDASIKAGSIGETVQQYGQANADNPLPANPLAPINALISGAPVFAPGDSTFTVNTRGDLALGSVVDPGRQIAGNATLASVSGQNGYGVSWFTLWTPTSGVSLTSAGGNIAAGNPGGVNPNGVDAVTDYPLSTVVSGSTLYPPTLVVAAVDGSIYGGNQQIELAPSPIGQIEMLAGNTIYGGDWSMSGAALTTEATPFNPGYVLLKPAVTGPNPTILATNYFLPATSGRDDRSLFTFAADTVTTDLHAGDSQPARFYAGSGDIQGLTFGFAGAVNFPQPGGTSQNLSTVYIGAKPADIRAGGDIINLGQPYVLPLSGNPQLGSETFILNANPTDVSVIQAGGSIYYANVAVGGPGTLEVMAGGNIYQGDHGLIESIGPVATVDPYDHSSGANVIVMPGVGAAGPNWSAFANLYFNPANQGDPEKVSADVAQTYQDQLYQWLQQNFGYTGTEAGALTYFQNLPVPQQSVFDLQVYFSELNASGLEFNDPSSIRDKSYIRGKEAIATLFPTTGANGQPITYSGSLTMESGNEMFFLQGFAGGSTLLYDSGIHTEFGGNVQIVDPGGAVTVGANATQPGPGTGILTEGSGDVDIYAQGSVELGLSRIFTTFGGDIVIWSADGDIAAGRGAKGTTVFAPARRVYTDYGVVALSPTVPTTGAGIATLAPIPDIPPGNINLIAPLGTVDAGEAGIRVSGNINIAALQVINAANIQVQGTATGIPQATAVNVGALTAASNASAAVTQIAQQVAQQPPPPLPVAPIVMTVRFLGFGDPELEQRPR